MHPKECVYTSLETGESRYSIVPFGYFCCHCPVVLFLTCVIQPDSVLFLLLLNLGKHHSHFASYSLQPLFKFWCRDLNLSMSSNKNKLTAFWRQRQKDCKFKVSLDYIARTFSKTKQQQKNK
jgi:hypothetical protein